MTTKRRFLEQCPELEKVQLVTALFNQCSLNELLIIEQLHTKKVFYKMAVKGQVDETAIDEDMLKKPSFQPWRR